MDKHDKYPVFEANQVLSHTHLNEVRDYLDKQERLTRANLIGIGIVCGLEIVLEKDGSGKPKLIRLSKGCGVTSQGYLIIEPDSLELTKYRKYSLPENLPYPPFVSPSSPFDLLELLPEQETTGSPLAGITNISELVMVLFLELKMEGLRTCSPNDCNDRGSEVTATVRHLLVKKVDLNGFMDSLNTSSGSAAPKAASLPWLYLPEIRLPRIDVPRADLITTQDIFIAFHQVFQTDLISNTIEAFKVILGFFGPLFHGIHPSELVDDFKAKFGFLKTSLRFWNLNQVEYLQYYYDFFGDLLQAYEELREVGTKLLSICCPPDDLFPRHLMLGAFDASTKIEPKTYRHYFQASPVITGEPAYIKELQHLLQRLLAMIKNFTIDPELPSQSSGNELDEQIYLTPSILGDAPLSQKAIPYYYLQDGAPPLNELWNYEKSQQNRANLNLSYHSYLYEGTVPDFVIAPLKYDLEPYNFLRIEGHLKKNYKEVQDTLYTYKTKYRLPIEIISLATGPVAKQDLKNTATNYLESFLLRHPGIQHKAGVTLGGTFILVYHTPEGVSTKDDSQISLEDIESIKPGTVIADFFLPYRLADFGYQSQILVKECEYEWIDSIRHIHNLSLRDYRFNATAKAPAAHEAERERLKDNYIIRIYRYEIQGQSLSEVFPVDITIPIKLLKTKQLSAVAAALNDTFPLGLVFDNKPNSNKILIRYLVGQRFRIELGGIQGNQIRYAYENDKVYRWHLDNWEEFSHNDVSCSTLGRDYQEEDYRYVHEAYPPHYPEPAPISMPSAKDAITWEKWTLIRARSFNEVQKLPQSVRKALKAICKAIQEIDADARAVLVGSWANGSWVSPYPEENENSISAIRKIDWTKFITMRRKVTEKSGPSNITILIDSKHVTNPDMLKVSTAYKIYFVRGKRDAQKGLVLIDENGPVLRDDS